MSLIYEQMNNKFFIVNGVGKNNQLNDCKIPFNNKNNLNNFLSINNNLSIFPTQKNQNIYHSQQFSGDKFIFPLKGLKI